MLLFFFGVKYSAFSLQPSCKYTGFPFHFLVAESFCLPKNSIFVCVTFYSSTILMSFRNLVGKNWHVCFLRTGRKLVKNINRYGGNASFVELHEVGAYDNSHSLMPDLKGQRMDRMPQMVGRAMLKSNDMPKNKEKCGLLDSKQEAAFVISTPISVRTLCPEVVR